MLNRVAVAMLGVLFFCGSTVSAPRLPKFSSYPDLITTQYGKLTSTWAQEAIGVYEGHAFLKEVGAEISSPVPRIGVMDVGFDIAALLNNTRLSSGLREQLTSPPTDLLSVIQNPENFLAQPSTDSQHGDTQTIFYSNMGLAMMDENKKFMEKIEHGTVVTHLLAGELPFGVSARGEVDSLFMLATGLEIEQEAQRLGSIAAQEVLPDILNLSTSFGAGERVFTPTELLAPFRELARRTLVVTSAGNFFPDPIESLKRELLGEIIIVGSSEPSGCASSLSPAGERVTICVPSDLHLQTIGSGGRLSFGGTSAAAPLVTGALADVLSILPSLTVSEAIHMLRKTAVTGAVLSLNYYKLMRVTAKLANHGWPEHREKNFSEELYDFTAEAQQLLASADNSSSTEEVFTQLRQAFFLDPTNTTTRAKLADLYSHAGYTAQALFYGNEPTPTRDTTVYDFLTALAEADIERLTAMLPVMREEKFWKKISFSHIIQYLDEDGRHRVAEFLKQQGIVAIAVTDVGEIKWEKL